MILMPDAPSVDGIAAPPSTGGVQKAPLPTPDPDRAKRRAVLFILLVLGGIPYAAYVLWSLFLLTILPDVSGAYNSLIPLGIMIAIVAGVLALAIIAFGLLRIREAVDIPLFRRRIAAIRLIAVTAPVLALSVVVPMLIGREPALSIAIVSPAQSEDFIAPLSVTFSVRDAVAILARRQLTPEKYVWDFEGDGKMNAETTDPEVTAAYDRQGQYLVSVAIFLKGASDVRRISTTLTIPDAVFSVEPNPPVVDEPVRLSVAQLLAKPEDLEEVHWHFEGGEPDLVVKTPDVVHTFFVEGPTYVSVTVKLKSKTQQTYERTIEVIKAVPLPFDVMLTAEPEHLIGPSPFGAVFRVETKESIRTILWNFGDGAESRGERVGHTFTREGVYAVTAELRAVSGAVAKVTKVVRVVPSLSLSDLSFTGKPEVKGNRISGEVPVIVDLKPRTSVPLIDFLWEAPDATSVGSTKDSVQAVYRREGVYTLTLLGQDPDGRALRLPITVEVLPVSSSVVIRMDPDGGVAPLTVRFDASESIVTGEQISGFEWKFSDEKENVPHQQGAQVSHIFRKPGTYEITVKVFTTSGKEFSARKTIVVRTPAIDACISASRIEGKAPLGIQFSSDCSTLGQTTTFEWDFGDGWTSDTANPTHDFEQPGTYQVILTLHDGESLSQSDPLLITVQP